MRQNLDVNFIGIFLVAKNVEPFFLSVHVFINNLFILFVFLFSRVSLDLSSSSGGELSKFSVCTQLLHLTCSASCTAPF